MVSRLNRCFIVLTFAALFSTLVTTQLWGQTPSAKDALVLRPIQNDVDYEQPTGDEVDKCVVSPYQSGKSAGWVVKDNAGRLLRKFLDSNADDKVDLWCYYKNGVEVYRDVDVNFNGKADQYRWLGTSGTRWALDRDEDGRIDSWKSISAEEVSAEAVAAVRDKDIARFRLLLATESELDSVGFIGEQRKSIAEGLTNAAKEFTALARDQKKLTSKSEWVHFGATRPGVIAAGTEGAAKDIFVYDNAIAMVQTGEKHEQISLGGLVRVGDVWRLIDLPHGLVDEPLASGVFFGDAVATTQTTVAPPMPEDSKVQQLIRDLQNVEASLAKATAMDRSKLHSQRCDLLEDLIPLIEKKEDRDNWIRQYADTVTTAMQASEFPAGERRLIALKDQLKKNNADKDLAGYVQYRLMTVAYSDSLQKPDADFAKIQDSWLKSLTSFVSEYPNGEDAADAMIQLALAEEFAGKEADAIKWYTRITKDFPKSPLANKATGALRRIGSVGKTLDIGGNTLAGGRAGLSQYRGKVVLVHYWATWCEPCKDDMKTFRELQAKYAQRGFALLGINLDNDITTAQAYLRANRLPWAHLYQEGGLESPLATQLGVLTLPTMLLVGKDGRVISRNITVGELSTELPKQLR